MRTGMKATAEDVKQKWGSRGGSNAQNHFQSLRNAQEQKPTHQVCCDLECALSCRVLGRVVKGNNRNVVISNEKVRIDYVSMIPVVDDAETEVHQ